MEDNKKKVYTISEIAQELGVSITTVSRALSGKGRIGQKTRDRIVAFADEHGYTPNVMAKGLAEHRTYNLGMVLPADFGANDASFFSECLRGISEMAFEYGYDIVVSISNGKDISHLKRMVMNRKVDGVITSRTIVSSALPEFLKEQGMPFVLIGPGAEDGTKWVDNNNREASRELTSIMLMKGGRRLALFGGSQDYLVTQSRLKGFMDAHDQMGLIVNKNLIFMDIENDIRTMNAVRQCLTEAADGIICMDDSICNMALSCLRERGIRVPEEMKLASMYDSRQLQQSNPPVTALHFDSLDLGKKACAMLLRELGEDVSLDSKEVRYQMILRDSTK